MYLYNECLSYITHFVVLHPFLRRPQILLTFIRQITLIKSNLRKKEASPLEYSSNNLIVLVYISKLQWVFTLYVESIILNCNNFEHVLRVVTIANCLS